MAMPSGYAQELLHIKVLLLRKQYQQCIKACLEVIRLCSDNDAGNHPLSAVYATFYLGLAHDELARSMHEQSALKLPTFQQAEQHYRQTIAILPTVEQCRAMLVELDRDTKPVDCGDEGRSLSPPLPSESSTEFTDPQRLSLIWKDEKPPQPADEHSGEPEGSDASNYDSDDSFDDILTPHRVLKRDVSRMSLLDQPLQRDYSSMSLITTKPKLSKSTSQGLLRPIRPGSPPKQYHLPPKLPYYGQNDHYSRPQRSELTSRQSSTAQAKPPLTMSALAYSLRVPSSPAQIASSSPAPKANSPVSPVNSHDLPSELSTVSPVSPVSPQTPSIRVQRPSPTPDIPELVFDEEPPTPIYNLNVVSEHLTGMRTQLQTHLDLLQRAKLAMTVAQAERAARSNIAAGARLSSFTDRESHFRSSRGNRPSSRVPQSKSFWSFTPVDVKVAERQKKIEEGRARGWAKKRYQSGKYVALVESALAEL